MRTALAVTIGLVAFAALPAQAATPRDREIVGLLNTARRTC
jgi:hypothetical protein